MRYYQTCRDRWSIQSCKKKETISEIGILSVTQKRSDCVLNLSRKCTTLRFVQLLLWAQNDKNELMQRMNSADWYLVICSWIFMCSLTLVYVQKQGTPTNYFRYPHQHDDRWLLKFIKTATLLCLFSVLTTKHPTTQEMHLLKRRWLNITPVLSRAAPVMHAFQWLLPTCIRNQNYRLFRIQRNKEKEKIRTEGFLKNRIYVTASGMGPEKLNRKANRLGNEQSPYLLQHAYNPVRHPRWDLASI